MGRPAYRPGLPLLLAPFLTGTVVLVPALVTAVFASTRYDRLGPPELVGLDTFHGLLSYGQPRDSLGPPRCSCCSPCRCASPGGWR